jgi:hypothetical protein
MEQMRLTSMMVVAAILAGGTGCQLIAPSPKAEDPIAIAGRHFATRDVPDSGFVDVFMAMSAKGDVRASMWCAYLYTLPRPSGVEKARQLSKKLAAESIAGVEKLAESGDPEAEFLLATAYRDGLGITADLKEAFRWMSKAADAGELSAITGEATLLARGCGTEPDIVRARALFQKALALHSFSAAKQLAEFRADPRDDSARFKRLRAVSLAQAVGMRGQEGIAFLFKANLIANPKEFTTVSVPDATELIFPSDGILLKVANFDRIVAVEGHAKGAPTPGAFRGEIPFGLSWMTPLNPGQDLEAVLGVPDDEGTTPLEEDLGRGMSKASGYGVVYSIENVRLVLIFGDDQKLKIWRVYEKWGAVYPPPVLISPAVSK